MVTSAFGAVLKLVNAGVNAELPGRLQSTFIQRYARGIRHSGDAVECAGYHQGVYGGLLAHCICCRRVGGGQIRPVAVDCCLGERPQMVAMRDTRMCRIMGYRA